MRAAISCSIIAGDQPTQSGGWYSCCLVIEMSSSHQWSDQICTALQLANHWQDVAIDLDKDRVYVPKEDLSQFGLTADDLMSRQLQRTSNE